MAKKQQIILTHGSGMPSENVLKELKLGEVLVQHASEAKNAALHTVRTEGDADSIVSFPSKEYVDDKFNSLNTSITGTTGVASQIEGLTGRIEDIEEDYLKASDKTELNNLITAETSARTSAITNVQNSITAETSARTAADNALDGRINAITEDYLKASDKTELNNLITAETSARTSAITNVQNSINTKTSELSDRLGTGVTSANTVTTQLNAITNTIESLGDTYATDAEVKTIKENLESEIAKAKTTLATGTTGNVKVTQSTTDPNKYTVEGVGLATTATTNALDGRLTSAETKLNTIQGSGDGSIAKAQADAIASAKTYTDGEVDKLEAADTELSNRLGTGITTASTVTAQLKAVTDAIGTIQGDDTSLSMRNIAANEVAKVVANAPENFDTLKEIADWITSDNTGAAGISNDVTELKGTVTGFTSTNTIKKTTDALGDRLTSAETKLNTIQGSGDGSIAKAQADAIASAKTYTDGEVDKLEAADTELSNRLGTGVTSANTVTAQLNAITNTIESLGDTYATDAEVKTIKENLESEIAKAKTTLATGTTGNVKVTQSTTDPNKYTVEGVGLATTATTNALDGRLTSAETKLNTIQGSGDGSIAKAQADAIASAKTYTDGEVDKLEAKDTELSNRLGTGVTTASTVTAQLKAATDRVTTIEGKYITAATITNSSDNKITATAANNVITFNFDNMVIDGGTY